MKVTTTNENKKTIIRIDGRLDASTAQDLDDCLSHSSLQTSNGVILDIKELHYISSAGLRVILNVSKKFCEKGISFSLCNMQDHVVEVFEISGFDQLVKIYSSIETAIESQ